MKHLLQHFKTLTKQPQNAEELKGLILQLAIQGRLTENWRKENPNVESASDLLKRIEAEKKQLIKEKKIKNSKRLPIVDDDEKYFEIPNTWVWERLGNIGNIFNGNSVNKSIKQAKYEGLEEGYPYIATKDVGYLYDAINHDNGVRIPFDEPKFKVARKNTVLICSEGGSAGKKMGILERDCCFGNKLYAVEQYGEIESLYILSLYGSLSFSKAFKDNMTGIIGGISRSNFANLIIPLPPLEEQKAIVEVVNELFKEVEQLEAQTKTSIQLKEDFVTSALQRLTQADNVNQEWQFLQPHFTEFFTEKENIKQLRETILQLAVQGKLTAKWRTCHPELVEGSNHASELLKRIQTEKQQLIAQKKIKKEKPLPPIEDHEKPYELPKGWVWCRFGDASINLDGFRVPVSKAERAKRKGHYDYYGAQGVIDKIDDYIFDKSLLLIAEDGGNLLRRTKPVAYMAHGKYWVNNHAHVVDSINETGKYYCEILINSIDLSPHLNGQPPMQIKLNRGRLNLIPTPLPPLEEQKAIVKQVNSLMALCDSLEEHIDNIQTQIEQLMQSCLKEVFEN